MIYLKVKFMSEEEIEVPLKTLILALTISIVIFIIGLIIYFSYKNSEFMIAIYGIILVFAGLMSLSLFPGIIIQKIRKRRMFKVIDSNFISHH